MAARGQGLRPGLGISRPLVLEGLLGTDSRGATGSDCTPAPLASNMLPPLLRATGEALNPAEIAANGHAVVGPLLSRGGVLTNGGCRKSADPIDVLGETLLAGRGGAC